MTISRPSASRVPEFGGFRELERRFRKHRVRAVDLHSHPADEFGQVFRVRVVFVDPPEVFVVERSRPYVVDGANAVFRHQPNPPMRI